MATLRRVLCVVVTAIVAASTAHAQASLNPPPGCTQTDVLMGTCRPDSTAAAPTPPPSAKPRASRVTQTDSSLAVAHAASSSPRIASHFVDEKHNLGVTIGGGLGSRDLSCSGCTQDTGISGFLGVNGFIGKTALFGLEGTGWFKSQSGVSGRVLTGMVTMGSYWSRTVPLLLSVGVGVVSYHESAGRFGVTGTGFGSSGRLSYEARIGRGARVGPYIGYVFTIGGADFGGFKTDVTNLQFGMAFTLR
jgi:hypothetical protein